MIFPLARDEWYQRRDDRTNRVGDFSGYQDMRIGVIVDARVEESLQIQAMLLVAMNTIVRWCRNIKIEIKEDALFQLNVLRGQNIKAYLQKLLLEIDPYVNLEFGIVDERNINQILVIGQGRDIKDTPPIWINCDGWLSGVGRGIQPDNHREYEDENILGASFSACLGCAELFRQAIGGKAETYNQWFSLLDYRNCSDKALLQNAPSTKLLNLGYIHQIGCGAIGSSFDFLLSLTNWKYKIALIDYDPVDYTNCNRSLLFTAYDAAKQLLKTGVCTGILNNENVVYNFEGSYSEFIEAKGFLNPPPDLILCFANERNIWSTIQNNYPPLAYHATTTPNWGINFGRHIPKKEGCILCRFSEESQKSHHFVPKCSTGTISEENNKPTIDGVLPFLSPASAILVLAELAKTSHKAYPTNKNFIEFSFKNSKTNFLVSQATLKENCVCGEQSIDIYSPTIKETKYWHLVE